MRPRGVTLISAGVLLAGLATAALVTAALGAAEVSSAKRTPIQTENARRGTAGWSSGLFDSSATTATAAIQGYSSEVSTSPGGVIHLHVSVTPAQRYRIQVFRLGWYRGVGARRLACIPRCGASKRGVTQKIPTPDRTTGEIDAHWPVTDLIRTKRTWVSGYYFAKLIVAGGAKAGKVNFVPFIVTAPASRSAILVEASVNTWQAYNGWGGKSLYDFNSPGGAAVKVSFNRPSSGNNSFFNWEYPLARFLERSGYDVSYTTDVDVDRNPGLLLRHRLVIDSGHGEYWTSRIRDAYESAKSRGVNLAFLGADIGDWQIRYENGSRTIVEYRTASRDPNPDPAAKTVRFRDLTPPRPQCTLLGIQYTGGLRTDFPQPTDYGVNRAALNDTWFRGTGFTASSTLPGLIGYEWDGLLPACQAPGTTVFFHASGKRNADAVRYVAPSGATIFSSGSLQFVWGLDDWNEGKHADPHLQRFMKNAIGALTKR